MSPLRLAVNATELGRQRGGNESCLLGLLEGLQHYTAQVQVTLIVADVGASLPFVAGGPWSVVNVGPYRRVPFYLWQQSEMLRRLDPDWYLSTFFLPPRLACKGAVIVHDLSFRARPGDYPRHIALYMRLLTGQAIRQADRVLAGSEFTRHELERFYRSAAHKTAVISYGVGGAFQAIDAAAQDDSVLSRYGIVPPYILAIGNIHPRKNLSRLLAAYARWRSEFPTPFPQMVWVGLPRWGSSELLQQATAMGVILTGYVPQEHLPALYRRASVFVYPSLYEGFGLPVVEAMACGTPVVCSSTTSLPEVVGDAALQVDPEDVKEMATAMRSIYSDAALSAELRARGLQRVARFTWSRAAHLLLDALGTSEST